MLGGLGRAEFCFGRCWVVLYAKYAGSVSQSSGSVGNKKWFNVKVCTALGLTVSERLCAYTERIRQTWYYVFKLLATFTNKSEQTSCIFLGAITDRPDISVEIARIMQRAWGRYYRYKYELNDRPIADLTLNVRMLILIVEDVETIFYERMTWSPLKTHYDQLAPGPSYTPMPLYRMVATEPNGPMPYHFQTRW